MRDLQQAIRNQIGEIFGAIVDIEREKVTRQDVAQGAVIALDLRAADPPGGGLERVLFVLSHPVELAARFGGGVRLGELRFQAPPRLLFIPG